LAAVALLVAVGPLAAAPADHVYALFPCCGGPAPGGCRIIATRVGAPTCVGFAPWDANDAPDPTWTGFMGFTSSDPRAALPAPCAFPASEQNCSGIAYVTFQTPGRQTVTIFDVAGVLTPATISIEVEPNGNPIPDLDALTRLLLVAALAAAGVTLLGRRAQP
jgi:hypothetical protein